MAPISSPCAVCKFFHRKCSSDCIFAPYFPQDQMQKFINLHRVYGTSNVQKLLAELPVDQRQDAVNSLAYEAEARRLDPVYGCVGPIVFLQHRVKNLKIVLQDSYKELAAYQDAVLQTQQAMGMAGFPAAQPMPDMMHPLEVNPLSASSSSEPYKISSVMGIPTNGSSLEIREPGPQSKYNNTFHPKQPFMPTATVGREEQQEIIRAFELKQHRQDNRFDMGQGFNVGAGSSTGVGAVGFGLNDPGPQNNNNTNTLHPEQLVMPIATDGTEQQEIIRAFELQQHGQDIRFDWGRAFDVGTGSSNGVGVVGYSLNDAGPQSNNNNNTLHPEKLVVPVATTGTEQQETLRVFELQPQGQDIRFDNGRGFNVGAGSSTGVGDVGFSLNDPGPQSNNNNNAFYPEQLVMSIATVGSEQQETIRAFELQQQGQDFRFDGGRGFNFGARSSTGVGVVGFSRNDLGPQSNNNNNTSHPDQLVMPTANVGTEQLQQIIRDFDLQQHGQDIRIDTGQGFDVGTGSNSGVGVVGFSLNDPSPQSNKTNNTLRPEQLVMPIATVGSEQQETIRAFELQQQGQDFRFDGGRGFNVEEGSSTGVGVVGFSLNGPGPQSNNNNTFHSEQLFMPTATVGTDQLQEILRDFDLQQHGQDIKFDMGQGFDVVTGSCSGVGVVGFSLNDPGPLSKNNNETLDSEQLVMPIATVGMEQQEIIKDFEVQRHGLDIRFDGGEGFDVGTGSSSGVGVVGFSLNDLGPQSNKIYKTLHPEQLVMPIATVGTEQQEIVADFELQQHGKDITFDWGRGFDVGTGSCSGVEVEEFSLNDPSSQSNNNNLLHPEQLVIPIATVGKEQHEIIGDFELQQHGQDFRFDWGKGFDVGTGSSSGVGVVGFSLNDPGPQSNNNNNTLHPEPLVMPISTVGMEQQEIIRTFELHQHGQDILFNWGVGFDVGTGSNDGVVGFSRNDPGPQSNNHNNTLYPEQLVMPISTVGCEQQETIRAFELQQHRQDIRFDGAQGFDVGEGSSTGVGEVGFSLNNLPSPPQVSPHPMMGSFESGFSHPHFQPQPNLQTQQVVAVQEHCTQELESQEEWLQGLNVGNGEAETGSSFYSVNR